MILKSEKSDKTDLDFKPEWAFGVFETMSDRSVSFITLERL